MKLTFTMTKDIHESDALVLKLCEEVRPYLPESAAGSFEIALSEAITNAVKHADIPDGSGPFEVMLLKRCGLLVVVITDPPGTKTFYFPKTIQPLDEIDAFAESGRGNSLIQACADSVRYCVRKGRNRLLMAFNTEDAGAEKSKSKNLEVHDA